MIGQPRPLGEHLQGLDPSTVCSVPALSGLSFRSAEDDYLYCYKVHASSITVTDRSSR